ncbi:MAG: archease [Candidatus Thermoplasmatota archaeon]|nr:archease [Candidatus Thermoplasmatota archaeon]MCL5790108.1 archease [Candidatus Thermoplasmatota archaeon]
MPVESIEHTADVRLRAWGRSFQGTLLELSNHMLKMVYGEPLHPVSTLESTVEYDSDEDCVIRLLNDIIYRAESSNLAVRVRKVTICKGKIHWEGYGETAGRNSGGSALVKAATYDRIVARRSPPLVEITLDI